MVKFNYEGLVDRTINNAPNSQKKWWLYDLYESKTYYWNKILQGRL